MATTKDVESIKSKNELAKFAQAELGIELELHLPFAELKKLCIEKLEAKNGEGETKEKKAKKKTARVGFLRHPTNHRVYPFDVQLEARGDMIPCYEDGSNLDAEDAVDEKKKKKKVKNAKTQYLKHSENGRVFPYDVHLAARGDMTPCDADGNEIEVEETP